MAFLQLLLFVLMGLNMATMFSGFMLARRMGMYLMKQVMMLMFGMMVGMIALIIGLFFPPVAPVLMFDLLHILILVDFVFILLGTLMQFLQVLPILMKTMQGAPFHSSHITNLLVTFFYLLALVIFYAELAVI
ncbi:MAG: hypothetical protein ACTSQZ_08430 [Candidatus Thorarchaeota archaeon]